MPTAASAQNDLASALGGGAGLAAPKPTRLPARDLYYLLVNVEEHPEVLPMALDLVAARLQDVAGQAVAVPPQTGQEAAASLDAALAPLQQAARQRSLAWREQAPTAELKRRRLLHGLTQFAPTAWVDGCWLQGGMRVAIAHTAFGASLAGLYQHQLHAFVADTGSHFIADYRAACARLGGPVEDVAARSFVERADLADSSLPLPLFLLAIGQFPRSISLEILGVNLAWQFLELGSVAPALIDDACEALGMPASILGSAHLAHQEKGRERAHAAALQALEGLSDDELARAWQRLMLGMAACERLALQWFDSLRHAAAFSQRTAGEEMIEMLRRKAPHAHGFHGKRALGAHKLDDLLDPKSFDGAALLEGLAASPWVKAGRSDKSALVNRLVSFGGPMLGVFSPDEIDIMKRWIDSLPDGDARAPMPGATDGLRPAVPQPLQVEGRCWDRAEFRAVKAGLSTRELYHRLVNVEYHPDVLPVAERFAQDRLERSMAMLWRGDRPIPSDRYDPRALEEWVYRKHREQVDSYRPPDVLPEAPKAAFIEGTVQLAPLILIDGGWLQGMVSPALIHTPVARMLLHVLVEEIGEGQAAEHHANIYRKLLAAMGVEAPPVESREFAQWPRLLDSSFEVPALWLSISCFPRHFMPEILGLNLAVELAGVGGPYMEARDTLRRFRLPTTFVEVHNAADNVSKGHSAWAMNAIKRYMDEVAERDGPRNVDRVWHRVWSGVRATLPQISQARLSALRLRRRLLGGEPAAVPLIFSA